MITGMRELIWLVSVITTANTLDHVRVSEDGSGFVRGQAAEPFVVWGVNYDHDRSGRLLDEYWIEEWKTVEEDFREMKALGANCVRIHLQLGKFMETADKPNAAALEQLAKLVKLAENQELYLDITGLACYHKANIPAWYDQLSEQDRWKAQALFWEAVARTCGNSPAIFCYDLMNEPILAGKAPEAEWLAGELAGKFFVQRITLDLQGRTREEVATAWVNTMVDAIRKHDRSHLVTVGVIPWVFVFGGGEPLFYSPQVGERLDFVSVHFYPKKGEVDKALKALNTYEVGKPLVVEELFPLACSEDELVSFIRGSSDIADGWISFYWGASSDELRAVDQPTLAETITASWLVKFQQMSQELHKVSASNPSHP